MDSGRRRCVRALGCAGHAVAVGALVFALAVPAHPACQVATVARIATDPNPPNLAARIVYTAAPSFGAPLNREGLAERLSDVLIFDSGAGSACFSAGNLLTLSYNVALTSAPGLDVFDSRGAGLSVTASANTAGTTTVSLTVAAAGIAGNLTTGNTGSAIRVRGARADVTPLSAGLNVTVTVSATAPGALSPVLRNVGAVYNTMGSGGIASTGAGPQNSDATLVDHALFRFTENFASAFRPGGVNVAGVAGDGPTGATSLVLDAGNTIPLGVTVTFPGTIVAGSLAFTLRRGDSCSGPAQCYAVYDTTQDGAGIDTVTVTTGASPRTGETGSTPAIGVHIGPLSGAGTATLRALFGPGVDGDGNDDISPGAVPRYAAAARLIFSGSWFTVAPTVATLGLSPASVSFPDVMVGEGLRRTVILTNSSTLPLQIAAISVSQGDFRQWNNCGAVVAGMQSCTIDVEFVPTYAGGHYAVLTVESNAAGSPHRVPLSGQGLVVNPVPTITALVPGSAQAGLAGLRLVVRGSDFAPGAVVTWNDRERGTTVVGGTEVSASILLADLATPGSVEVRVVNPSPGGGASNPLHFIVGEGPIPPAPYLYYLPHVVTGGGYLTGITAVDLTNAANSVTLNYVSQAGLLLRSEQYPLAPGGTLRVATAPEERFGASQTRWAIVGAQKPVAINISFEYAPAPGDLRVVNTVGFNDAPPLKEFTIPVEFEPQPPGFDIGRTVGIAIANPSGAPVSVELRLVDKSGTVLGTHTLSLPPFGQAAVDMQALDSYRAALPAQNWFGSVMATAGAPVSVIALKDSFGPFAAVPVVPGRAK